MNEPVSTRKVTWRGECPHCGKRQKVNKGNKKIGSHFKGGVDTYCPGVFLAPVPGSVREYITPVKQSTVEYPSSMRTLYKWAVVAAITVVALAAVVIVSYYAGEAIT